MANCKLKIEDWKLQNGRKTHRVSIVNCKLKIYNDYVRKMSMTATREIMLCLTLLVVLVTDAKSQSSFVPAGQRVVFDALDPMLRKWYPPQELYRQYKWEWWKYSNYAKDLYQRDADIQLKSGQR